MKHWHHIETWQIIYLFLFNGTLVGAWASHIPVIVERFNLSHSNLTFLLLVIALGAVASFLVSGSLVSRLGANYVSRMSALPLALAFICISIDSSYSYILVSLLLFGCFSGTLDVSMNAMASRYEKSRQINAMSFFHSMFSVGTGAGAFLGAFTLSQHIAIEYFFSSLALLFTVGAIPLFAKLTADTEVLHSHDTGHSHNRFGTFFVLLAVIVFTCSVGEGGIADWSAVFMVDSKTVSQDTAALAFAIFSVSMVIMRAAGGLLVNHFGITYTLYLCALATSVGLVMVSFSDRYLGLFSGFALIGVGYANVIPLGFSMIAKRGHEEGKMIAYLSVFGYGGMLLGPVILGLVSTYFGIQHVFTGLAVIALVMTIAIHQLAHISKHSHKTVIP